MTRVQKKLHHLKTIRTHRKHVRKMCFKMGIKWQGITHDLSKYSPTEFAICKYYDGTRSPHQVCREEKGFSPCWMHHYHKNKHHWEYWLDTAESGAFIGIKIPYKYVIEMLCDMVGAGKAYMGDKWTCKSPWEYYESKCKEDRIMHGDSRYLLEILLTTLRELGEQEFIGWYKRSKKFLKDAYNKEGKYFKTWDAQGNNITKNQSFKNLISLSGFDIEKQFFL